MEELLLFAGLLILLCTYATLRWITKNIFPAYNHPIQATSQDFCRVITEATPNKTYILQQCTAMNQTETIVKETDTNTLTEIDLTIETLQVTMLNRGKVFASDSVLY